MLTFSLLFNSARRRSDKVHCTDSGCDRILGMRKKLEEEPVRGCGETGYSYQGMIHSEEMDRVILLHHGEP